MHVAKPSRFLRYCRIALSVCFAVSGFVMMAAGLGLSDWLSFPREAVAQKMPKDYHGAPLSRISRERAALLQQSVDTATLSLGSVFASLPANASKAHAGKAYDAAVEALGTALSALSFGLGGEVYFTAWDGTTVVHSPLAPDATGMDCAEALDERGTPFVQRMHTVSLNGGGFLQATLPRQMPFFEEIAYMGNPRNERAAPVYAGPGSIAHAAAYGELPDAMHASLNDLDRLVAEIVLTRKAAQLPADFFTATEAESEVDAEPEAAAESESVAAPEAVARYEADPEFAVAAQHEASAEHEAETHGNPTLASGSIQEEAPLTDAFDITAPTLAAIASTSEAVALAEADAPPAPENGNSAPEENESFTQSFLAAPNASATAVEQVVYVKRIPCTNLHIAAFMPEDARIAPEVFSAWNLAQAPLVPPMDSDYRKGLCLSGFAIAGLGGLLLLPAGRAPSGQKRGRSGKENDAPKNGTAQKHT